MSRVISSRTIAGAASVLLPFLLAPARSFAAIPTSEVEVSVEVLVTTETGPTSRRGRASTTLRAGETGRLFAAAGQLDNPGGECSTMVAVPPRGDEAAEAAMRGTLESIAGTVSYWWEISATVVELRPDAAKLEVHWAKKDSLGNDSEGSEYRHELDLPFGSKRLLEVAPFSAPHDDASCQVESHALQIEALPAVDAALSEHDLVFEFWFARTADDQREDFGETTYLGRQVEELGFIVPALEATLPIQTDDGRDVRMRTQCRGTIRAWATGPSTIAVEVSPALHHGLDVEGGTRISAGRGRKFYEARIGETVELALPEMQAVLRIPAEGRSSSDPAIEHRGRGLLVDLGRLSGEARYSLLVRIRWAD